MPNFRSTFLNDRRFTSERVTAQRFLSTVALSEGVLAFLTKANGDPITKADDTYLLKGA